MYKIDESKDREKYILLIPAMLDYHFPLMKYAFYSKNYHPVIIDLEENVENIGLKYVNNDMCYTAIMNAVIERRLSGMGHIANADIDTSGSRMNYYNRVHLLIHQN